MLIGACLKASTPEQNIPQYSRQEWLGKLKWHEANCQPDRFGSGTGIHTRRVAQDTLLVIVECERWSPYSTYFAYVVTDSAVTQLNFDQFKFNEADKLIRYASTTLQGTLLNDPQDIYIDVLTRYRGTGDCGHFIRYLIKNQHADLKEFRVRQCDSTSFSEHLEPFKWPVRQPPGH